MAKTPTNKLSIYLIKQRYSLPEDIFKDYEELEIEEISDSEIFYYGVSHESEPPWIKKFFSPIFNKNKNKKIFEMFTASAKAIFLVKINVKEKGKKKKRIFALAFGYGRNLLKPGVWEERFGLKTALNVIDLEKLRSINKKNMSVVPKLSQEQLTKTGVFADFGIDIEQDLIQGMTGKTRDEYEKFGQTITGADALSLSVKIDISNTKDFLKECYERYNSGDYKKYFSWIDHISETKDSILIEDLNKDLLKKIQGKDFDKTWMAIPDIVNWADISKFKFNKQSFGDDIDLPSYLEFLTDKEKQNLSLKILKNHSVKCISESSGTNIGKWSVYNCLYCEIEKKDETYILSNGKWYQIENNFVKEISTSFNSLKKQSSKINLPESNQGEHENKYNERVGQEKSDICNMDRKMIHHGGVSQQIEFCDLLTKDKKIIHVKRYGASSVLSHLFSQGLVSGKLFLFDEEFRKKLNKKFDEIEEPEYKFSNPSEKPKASEYEIVFAIISNSDEDLDIPFFSKVNIKNTKKELEQSGCKVSLLKIATKNTS